MTRPYLLDTSKHDETFAGLTYHIDGELVPMLTVEITPQNTVFFEHHVLLWKHPAVNIQMRPMTGMLKRMIAGMQIFITEAEGTGEIAFSRDAAGHIFAKHLRAGETLEVREHQFLAASQNIQYDFSLVKGVGSMLFGGTGFFVDRFTAQNGDGILWLHGYGNVFEKNLAAGEQIDIEPGGWLYKDPSVTMVTTMQRLTAGFLGGSNLIVNRFTGPGKIGLQSMYFSMAANT